MVWSNLIPIHTLLPKPYKHNNLVFTELGRFYIRKFPYGHSGFYQGKRVYQFPHEPNLSVWWDSNPHLPAVSGRIFRTFTLAGSKQGLYAFHPGLSGSLLLPYPIQSTHRILYKTISLCVREIYFSLFLRLFLPLALLLFL